VCNYVTDVALDCILLNRRMRFISGLCYVNNSSLQFLFNVSAKQELIKVIGLMVLVRSKRFIDDCPSGRLPVMGKTFAPQDVCPSPKTLFL